MLKYKTTKDIKISKNIVDKVIGQEESVNIIKKAVIVQSINPDLTLSFSKILGAKTTKTKIHEITTNTGKKIKVSKEHPFLSINKKGINWKNSGELKNKYS